ncbi:MAG TPA: 2Fe-2S iron-sulfur cluster-binding protein [Bryobacteraceae bacterium]|jgi:xanthine dehydrogenase YagT iron-sulfur-binding subunit
MNAENEHSDNQRDPTRRTFIEAAVLISGAAITTPVLEAQTEQALPGLRRFSLTINQVRHDLDLEPKVTLLDLLRERLQLTGTKKGCDHGQCGACTVIADGERIVSCLALAVCYEGVDIVTIEGLERGGQLHPMQAAFLEQDGFQCGFCTPGQICSAIAMLGEAKKGMPSAVAHSVSPAEPVELTEPEIRERMSGNICRCGAYPNIVAAIRATERS